MGIGNAAVYNTPICSTVFFVINLSQNTKKNDKKNINGLRINKKNSHP